MPETKVGALKSGNVVYQLMRNQILCFELEPGRKLSENLISAHHKISRAQVRDALSRLTEEGYIVVYPQKGTEVTLIDLARVRQSVYTHIILEQAVIRELCQMDLTKQQYQLMEETMRKKEKTEDESFDQLLAEHQLVYLFAFFCGREHIFSIFRTLDCDLLRVRYLQYRTFNSASPNFAISSGERSRAELQLMLDYIRRKETETACLLCESHFNAILGNAEAIRSIYPQYFL